MNREDFYIKMKEYLCQLDLEAENVELDKLYQYMQLLIQWNEKINLTAITQPEEIIVKHFVDSLTVLKYIDMGATIVDVGTGAGFPGIPIKVFREDVKTTLLDSLNKRILFLEEVINQIGIKDIKCIHARAEELASREEHREKYDIAISRAVANMSTLLEYTLPYVRKGGKVICMKGSNIEEELKQCQKAIKILGGELQELEAFELPLTDIKRNIIIIKKVKETPKQIPRKQGKPSKTQLNNVPRKIQQCSTEIKDRKTANGKELAVFKIKFRHNPTK
jgi:16S rRNA (guanine527-N7)-methyltransferase